MRRPGHGKRVPAWGYTLAHAKRLCTFRLRPVIYAALGLLYALYAGTLFLAQDQMLYPTGLVSAPEQPRLPDAESELWQIPVAGGTAEAWLLRPLNGAREYPVLLHGHGNGDVIDFLPPLFQWPRERGWGVLLVEYPGYGRSAGKPGEESIRALFTAAYDRLAARADVQQDRIVGYGWSLGGGAVCTLVGNRPLAGLLLRSTFTGLEEFAHRHLVPAFLLRDRYDNLSAVRRFQGPVAVFHGTEDTTIPYSMGRQLAEAADVPLHSFPCGHNGCPGKEIEFWQAAQPLLEKIHPPTE